MRGFFRFVSFAAVTLAFILAIVDGTTMISAKAWTFTSMGEFLARLLGTGAMDRFAAGVARNIHPIAWGLVDIVALRPPAAINLAIIALVSWMIGRQREDNPGLISPA